MAIELKLENHDLGAGPVLCLKLGFDALVRNKISAIDLRPEIFKNLLSLKHVNNSLIVHSDLIFEDISLQAAQYALSYLESKKIISKVEFDRLNAECQAMFWVQVVPIVAHFVKQLIVAAENSVGLPKLEHTYINCDVVLDNLLESISLQVDDGHNITRIRLLWGFRAPFECDRITDSVLLHAHSITLIINSPKPKIYALPLRLKKEALSLVHLLKKEFGALTFNVRQNADARALDWHRHGIKPFYGVSKYSLVRQRYRQYYQSLAESLSARVIKAKQHRVAVIALGTGEGDDIATIKQHLKLRANVKEVIAHGYDFSRANITAAINHYAKLGIEFSLLNSLRSEQTLQDYIHQVQAEHAVMANAFYAVCSGHLARSVLKNAFDCARVLRILRRLGFSVHVTGLTSRLYNRTMLKNIGFTLYRDRHEVDVLSCIEPKLEINNNVLNCRLAAQPLAMLADLSAKDSAQILAIDLSFTDIIQYSPQLLTSLKTMSNLKTIYFDSDAESEVLMMRSLCAGKYTVKSTIVEDERHLLFERNVLALLPLSARTSHRCSL